MVKFIVLIILLSLFNSLIDQFLVTDEIVYYSLIDKFSYERITEILVKPNNGKLISYLFLPVYMFLKISLVTICFFVGSLFSNKKKISLNKFFSLTVSAEFVFLIPIALKLIWFTFFEQRYSLNDLKMFSSSFSIVIFEPINKFPLWLKYPFQKINIFEACYWVVLSLQLMKIFETNFLRCLGFVAYTYGIGISLWNLFAMFILLSTS